MIDYDSFEEFRDPQTYDLELRHPEPQKFTTPDGGQLVITEQQHYDPMTQIQHYTCHHQWLHPSGQHEEKSIRTALRYVFPQEMEALLFHNGFQILSCYGNWQQDPLTATSRCLTRLFKRRLAHEQGISLSFLEE